MAHRIKVLAKRLTNFVIGLVMFVTSLFLIINVHVGLFNAIYTLNPYPFYFLGVIVGVERIFYSITGSTKIFSLIVGEGEGFFSIALMGIFLVFITFGIYIAVYTIFYSNVITMLVNGLDGASFLLFSLIIFKSWYK
ncbi:hypothetical protein SUSAZ_00525 [Sulfolobus acidocaldarius SUSAZ]|nr:hypothetical protein SUSAZ_00525 [Sulfolobus acidocaldarius SUSAZ]